MDKSERVFYVNDRFRVVETNGINRENESGIQGYYYLLGPMLCSVAYKTRIEAVHAANKEGLRTINDMQQALIVNQDELLAEMVSEAKNKLRK